MTRKSILALLICGAAATAPATANVRVNVRLGAGHPIHRPHRTVVVRPVRPGVVVRTTGVKFVAPVAFMRTVVTLPPRQRITWEDSETIHRREDWVDTTLHVNNRGDKLFLSIDGRAEVDFAEVYFQNGQVQVVDFREQNLSPGRYSLLNFADGRHVDSVRVIARARTKETRLTVLLAH